MRKYAVALLAVPILLIVYVGALLRRSPLLRGSVAIALGAVIAIGAIALVRPAETVATPPTAIVPLTQAAFRTIVATNVELDAAATIEFSTPMDRRSVEASIQVQPSTAVRLHWNDAGTALSIAPADPLGGRPLSHDHGPVRGPGPHRASPHVAGPCQLPDPHAGHGHARGDDHPR